MLPALDAPLGSLESIEVLSTAVTLKRPVGFAGGRHDTGRRIFIRVVTAHAEGFGEIGALDVPVGADPSLDQVVGALGSHWVDRLSSAALARHSQCPGSEAVALLGSNSSVDRVCVAGLEMAILDAELRLRGVSLASWLGVEASVIPYGGLVGLPDDDDLGVVVASASKLVEQGARRLRIKIRPGFAVEPVEALRAAFPSLALQADANGSFELDHVEELIALDAFGLHCIEEPLMGRDFASTAQLAQRVLTPLCLDESIQTSRHAADALRYEAARVLCLKPSRLGGLRQAITCQELASRQGASWFMGGFFEAGLGRAYLGALAGRNSGGLISDVVAPRRYLAHDPCDLPGPIDDAQPLWTAPGVGPWPSGPLEVVTGWSGQFGGSGPRWNLSP